MKNHQPVLLNEVLRVLEPASGQSYLDGTAGFGGHAAAVLERLGDDAEVVLVDRDEAAVEALTERFGSRARIMRSSYLEAAETLAAEGAEFDLILLDIGVSSPQIDNAERGFSFQQDAPLDMRMDRSQELTAATVVNDYRQPELERVLRDLGEEPRWRAVAHAIIAARPLRTTGELARVIRSAAAHTDRIDMATRGFQGIRIEVNAELEQLERALPVLESLLSATGRLAVISFHSLEDRLVKQYFERQSHGCVCPPKQPICTCAHEATLAKLTRKAVTATADEITHNPRARSAKLRAVEKVKTKGGTKRNVRQSQGRIPPTSRKDPRQEIV